MYFQVREKYFLYHANKITPSWKICHYHYYRKWKCMLLNLAVEKRMILGDSVCTSNVFEYLGVVRLEIEKYYLSKICIFGMCN